MKYSLDRQPKLQGTLNGKRGVPPTCDCMCYHGKRAFLAGANNTHHILEKLTSPKYLSLLHSERGREQSPIVVFVKKETEVPNTKPRYANQIKTNVMVWVFQFSHFQIPILYPMDFQSCDHFMEPVSGTGNSMDIRARIPISHLLLCFKVLNKAI